MRNVILSSVAGLLVGTIGALAYSYIADGSRLASLQNQLDDANAALATLKKDKQHNAVATSGAVGEIGQLTSTNADLRKQIEDLKSGAPAAGPSISISPDVLKEVLRGAFRNGMGRGQQRMFLLKTRLKLTPDQESKLKAAMDADDKARRSMFDSMRNGGKMDAGALANTNTIDATLKSILTPGQQADYQKVQDDEKNSRADMMASMQVNSMSPLLQLSDTQKDAVMTTIYQQQLSAPDPMTLMTDPNAQAVIAKQAAATQAALARVLTPDQLALYNQQSQTMGFGGGGFGGGRPRGNGGGGPPPGQ